MPSPESISRALTTHASPAFTDYRIGGKKARNNSSGSFIRDVSKTEGYGLRVSTPITITGMIGARANSNPQFEIRGGTGKS